MRLSDRVEKGLQWGHSLAMGQIKLSLKGMGRTACIQAENSCQSLNLIQGSISTAQPMTMYMFHS